MKKISGMKETSLMIYKNVLENRLARKKAELAELDKIINSGNDIPSASDKRKYVELKAIVNELENCIDIADSMTKLETQE